MAQKLGFDEEQDNVLESKANIKRLMLASDNFPSRCPSMKEALANPSLRHYLYKWSKLQFSSENLKFFAACDTLLSRLSTIDDEEKAASLRKINDDYVSDYAEHAVNISGSQRKKFSLKLNTCTTDAEMAALLPLVLEEPLNEIVRVMEFDLYPGFAALVDEVIHTRRVEQQKREEASINSVVMMLDNTQMMQDLLVFMR